MSVRTVWCKEAAITAIAAMVFALCFAAGCAPVQSRCYEAISINPAARNAIIFNRCDGDITYYKLPPLPTPDREAKPL